MTTRSLSPLLQRTISSIGTLDQASMAAARSRENQLTKPQGSLGRLEELAIQIAGITRQTRPRLTNRAVIVMAGDHGIVSQGVSAYPAAVTPQMVLNILNGGAAINVLARQAGARVVMVDVGVDHDFGCVDRLLDYKVACGTANFATEPAMRYDQAIAALEAGVRVVSAEADAGLDIVATGDMGIGNTTAASAIVATVTRSSVASVTGRGTGLHDSALRRKIATIEAALKLHQPDPEDALDTLRMIGGYEIAGLAGVILGGAARRIPVVIDGLISGAAALIAVGLAPQAASYLIAGHRSVEIGHTVLLRHLGLTPLLELQLRLGEGTGAVLAFSVIDAACRILDEMATFEEASVSNI